MSDLLTQLRAGQLAGATRLDLSCDLAEFPREILDLADTLEVLSLTGNRLTQLPDSLARLRKLRVLFCSHNDFDHLPDVIGALPQLETVGFRANKIRSVSDASLPASLRALILTDNQLTSLPAGIASCTRLQKLMLSGNRLRGLPQELAACEHLELLRLAANDLHELPSWLLAMPRLAWLAVAGNPITEINDQATTRTIPWSELQLLDKLGEGASGIIHRARWCPASGTDERKVAVKIFKGELTSDGLPASEMAASLAVGAHEHVIGILGQMVDHPEGAAGFVMALIDREFTPLAKPPSLDTCTRDLYAVDASFTASTALAIAQGVASATRHLHEHGVLHGDLYAHNILINRSGHSLLGDFGAAAFYPSHYGNDLQRLEVRAFGILVTELLDCVSADDSSITQALAALAHDCTQPIVSQRPLFAEVGSRLSELRAS